MGGAKGVAGDLADQLTVVSGDAVGTTDAATAARLLLGFLQANGDPANVQGMSRFGINVEGTVGVGMPLLRSVARETRRAFVCDSLVRHDIAAQLWSSGVHEARILAALVDVAAHVDEAQMERWVSDLDSWDLCDQVCGNLFDKSPLAWRKATEWATRAPEFVKRAGFVLMTQLAVHDKSAPDEDFEKFMPLIVGEATDERTYVKKAVSWALRQIGKRSARLNTQAVALAEEILARNPDSSSARWIARDALRELTSEAVRKRLVGREGDVAGGGGPG